MCFDKCVQTSYKELQRDALDVERHNLLHPDKEKHLMCRL